MQSTPLSEEHRQRNVTMTQHRASALVVLASNKRASRLMLHLWLAVLVAAALGRCVEVVGDLLPIGHLPRYSS